MIYNNIEREKIMGQQIKDKSNVQKRALKKIFLDILKSNEDIMCFHRTLTKDEKSRKVIDKSIKQTRKAMKIIEQVEHIEILNSLYNALISGKENYFVLFGTLITSKNNVVKWDKTEKGFKEFLRLEAEAKAATKKEYEDKLKQQEILEQAKKDGKKIEYAYEDGKLKPLIVEDKPN